MDIIYLLISISFIMAIGFLVAFVWSVKTGQQSDLITPAMRILMEDKPAEKDNIK